MKKISLASATGAPTVCGGRPDPLFLKTRENTHRSFSGSLIRRDPQVFGFAPFVRYRYVRNDSTLKRHDFEQHSADVGLTAVF